MMYIISKQTKTRPSDMIGESELFTTPFHKFLFDTSLYGKFMKKERDNNSNSLNNLTVEEALEIDDDLEFAKAMGIQVNKNA